MRINYFGPKLMFCSHQALVFVTGLLLLLSSTGVAFATNSAIDKTVFSMVQKGRSYDVLLYSPKPYNEDKSHPLIIVAPGIGGRLARFVRATGFTKKVNLQGFVIAYPQIDQHEDWRSWLSSENSAQAAGFFRNLIAEVSSKRSIQPDKVFLVGFSGGGILVLSAMCDLANEVTAFAVISASLPRMQHSTCNIKRSVPAIIIASRDDPVLPWNGGRVSKILIEKSSLDVLSISDTVDLWRIANKCDARPQIQPLANYDSMDGTTVTQLRYGFKCRDSSHILLYAITGGGHSWPGSNVKLRSFEGSISQDFRATDVIWEFFKIRQILQ